MKRTMSFAWLSGESARTGGYSARGASKSMDKESESSCAGEEDGEAEFKLQWRVERVQWHVGGSSKSEERSVVVRIGVWTGGEGGDSSGVLECGEEGGGVSVEGLSVD